MIFMVGVFLGLLDWCLLSSSDMANLPIFIEWNGCPGSGAIKKHNSLDTFRQSCDSYYGSEPELSQPEPVVGPEPVIEPVTDPVISSTTLLINCGFESDLIGWYSCGDDSNLPTSSAANSGAKALAISGGGCLYQEVEINIGEEY